MTAAARKHHTPALIALFANDICAIARAICMKIKTTYQIFFDKIRLLSVCDARFVDAVQNIAAVFLAQHVGARKHVCAGIATPFCAYKFRYR